MKITSSQSVLAALKRGIPDRAPRGEGYIEPKLQLRIMGAMDFDSCRVADGVAGNSGPFMSPKAFREVFLPHMATVANAIKKPWICHSDGDLYPNSTATCSRSA